MDIYNTYNRTTGNVEGTGTPAINTDTHFSSLDDLTPGSPEYVAQESATLAIWQAGEAEKANQRSIEQALANALGTLQTILDDTNANINANPAQRIKDEARALRRVIRLLIRKFDGNA